MFSHSITEGGLKTGKVNCVLGGDILGPFSEYKEGCITWRPSINEARRRDPQMTARCEARVEKYIAEGSISRMEARKARKEQERLARSHDFTPAEDDTLRELVAGGLSRSDIADVMSIPAIAISARLSQLRLCSSVAIAKSAAIADSAASGSSRDESPTRAQAPSRPTASEARITHPSTYLPVNERRFPSSKPCAGRCCKYREQCRHYVNYIESGKPMFECIASVGRCIQDTGTYADFVAFNGSHVPELITFAET